MNRGPVGECWFPVSDWFKRNLALLKKTERPLDYLSGVELVWGRDVARELAQAAGVALPVVTGVGRPPKYPFSRLLPGDRVIVPASDSARVCAQQWGQRHGVMLETTRTERGLLVERVA